MRKRNNVPRREEEEEEEEVKTHLFIELPTDVVRIQVSPAMAGRMANSALVPPAAIKPQPYWRQTGIKLKLETRELVPLS